MGRARRKPKKAGRQGKEILKRNIEKTEQRKAGMRVTGTVQHTGERDFFKLLCIAAFYSRKTHSDWNRQRKKQSWQFRRNMN